MAKRGDAHVLEIIGGQPGQELGLDVVGTEQLGILTETDPPKPGVDVQHHLLRRSCPLRGRVVTVAAV